MKVVDLTDSQTVQELLVGRSGDESDGKGLLSNVLPLIREKLTKDKWKGHPVYKQALVWCIKQLRVSSYAIASEGNS